MISMELDRRILQELIYERVRLSVNLCQLVLFEQDLDKSIQRAMASSSLPPGECDMLARELIEQAWERVEHEWEQLRDTVAVLGRDDCDARAR